MINSNCLSLNRWKTSKRNYQMLFENIIVFYKRLLEEMVVSNGNFPMESSCCKLESEPTSIRDSNFELLKAAPVP